MSSTDALANLTASFGVVQDPLSIMHLHDELWQNPKTGESMTIAASKSVKFAPGAVLKSAVNTEAK